MQILSVHNLYQIRGGEDESCESEERLLRERGHQVDIYRKHNYWVQSLSKLQLATRTVWSAEAYRQIKAKLRANQPYDIVHIQNFFPLISPAVYYAAKSEGIPVVQTLRNYRLLCPNALFFRAGQVCEDCLGKVIPYPGVVHGCYREDKAASLTVAAMITAHRGLKTWTRMVDRFIALTHFARNKFIEGGLPAEKIVVKPNFVHPDPGCGEGLGGYALYVGRLSVEKGLDTLLTAWDLLSQAMPLKIVGDGPLADYVREACAANPKIEWLGRQPMPEVHRLMGEASFLIFPSKWYETFGRVAVESFAKGTPVVAANIGAIAELIENQRTGLLFDPGDPADLAEKVNWLMAHPPKLTAMRQEVRREFETKYTAAINYQKLIEFYQTIST